MGGGRNKNNATAKQKKKTLTDKPRKIKICYLNICLNGRKAQQTHTDTLALKCVRDYLADPTKFNKRIMENVLNFIVGKRKKNHNKE